MEPTSNVTKTVPALVEFSHKPTPLSFKVPIVSIARKKFRIPKSPLTVKLLLLYRVGGPFF